MSEEAATENQLPVSEPLKEDRGENHTSEDPPAPSEGPKDATSVGSDPAGSTPAGSTPAETKEEGKAAGDPPMDWFEPLEDDDDANSPGRNDPDEESLVGETESIAGSERTTKRQHQ